MNYILKNHDYRLDISFDHNFETKDTSIQKYLNSLLMKELTDISSRERVLKRVFNYKSKIPIYIDRDNLLMCIRSYRLENSLYINYYSIKNYQVLDNYIIIEFYNNHSMKIHQKYAFNSQISKCREIISFFRNQKMFTSR